MPRMEKPARFVSDFYFDGMRDLDCVACATDTLGKRSATRPNKATKCSTLRRAKGSTAMWSNTK